VQISEDGGEAEVVFGGAEEVAISWVEGLPGARGALVIACPGGTCQGERAELYVVNLESLNSVMVSREVLRAWYAPTGHLVYVRYDGAVLAQPFDLGSLEVDGSAVPLFDGVRVSAGLASDFADIDLAPDGTLLYATGTIGLEPGAAQLVVVDLEGNAEGLPLAPRAIGWVGWSPDGQAIVYNSSGQIYTYDVVLGTTPRQITFEGTTNQMGVYSPDGARLAFASARDGTAGQDIFVKALDDDSPARAVVTGGGNQLPTQWVDDTLLLFEQYATATPDLWIGNPSATEPTEGEPYLSSEAALYDLIVSPDGEWAAYRSNETGAAEIYLRRFPSPGVQTRVSVSGGSVPYWSPDGNTLYYSRIDGPGRNTFFAARLRRGPVPIVDRVDSLFSIAAAQPFSGSGFHPDGDRWILASTVASSAADSVGRAPSEPSRLILVQNFFEELRRLSTN
jgi:hypothetical protein